MGEVTAGERWSRRRQEQATELGYTGPSSGQDPCISLWLVWERHLLNDRMHSRFK